MATDDDSTLRWELPEPPADEPAVCDFCGAPNPVWIYPASDFTFFTAPTLVEEFKGPWKACEACSGLIEQDDYDALTRRSSQLHLINRLPAAALPEAQRLKGEAGLLANVRALREHFRIHRTGPRVAAQK